MAKKEISKFFFFAAPNFSSSYSRAPTTLVKKYEVKERRIQKEKQKKNLDKNKLRKLRQERNKLKKDLLECETYCPFDLYVAINKSSLPPIPNALDKNNSDTPNVFDYFDKDLKRYASLFNEYDYRTWSSEGKRFLISVWSYQNHRPVDALNKLMRNPDSRKTKSILSAINKGIRQLDHPNIFKIELTNTEKRKHLYYLGKDCLGRSEKHVLSRMNEEFSFWPIFLGSNIGFDKNMMIGENRTGHGFYHIHEQRVWLTDSKHFENTHKEENSDDQRARIPDDVQIFVWNRDGGACVKCGSRENLAFDHIIPHSLGGSDTRRNLQILCDECNQKKGNRIGG